MLCATAQIRDVREDLEVQVPTYWYGTLIAAMNEEPDHACVECHGALKSLSTCNNGRDMNTYLNVQRFDSLEEAVRPAQVWRAADVFVATLLDHHTLIFISSVPEHLGLLRPQMVDHEFTSCFVKSMHWHVR